jgi:hypothetical protein
LDASPPVNKERFNKIQFNVSEKEDLDEGFMKKSLKSVPIEISDEIQNLKLVDKNLQDLSLLQSKRLQKLSTICLNRNQLTNINELSKFVHLTKIEVTDNQLVAVRLNLELLVELDLTRNKLTDVLIVSISLAYIIDTTTQQSTSITNSAIKRE